jgi:hypothetical protein
LLSGLLCRLCSRGWRLVRRRNLTQVLDTIFGEGD